MNCFVNQCLNTKITDFEIFIQKKERYLYLNFDLNFLSPVTE